jgi:hypothetical protein
MTWIKPWLLWADVPPRLAIKCGQELVLAVEITGVGFERALAPVRHRRGP